MSRSTRSERGSALIVATLLVSIILVGMGVFLQHTKLGRTWGDTFRVSDRLRMKADSGFELARADLLERASKLDFTQPPDLTSDQAAQMGLYFREDGQLEPLPRFSVDQDGILLEVYYIPPNDGLPNALPKSFTVISQATHRASGATRTVEGELALSQTNYSELAFAILKPNLLPDMTRFKFWPGEFYGHVHFGFKPYFYKPWGMTGEEAPHIFHGPVTSSMPNTEDGVAFDLGYEVNVQFLDGLTANYHPELQDSDDMHALAEDVRKHCTPGLPLNLVSGENVCLKFVDDHGIGQIQQWSCNNDSAARFSDLYVNERASRSDSSFQPLVTYTIPPEGVMVCHDGPVTVKGVVRGRASIVSEKSIRIAGDIRNADQDVSSADSLALMTYQDIVVPHQIPSGDWTAEAIDQLCTTEHRCDLTLDEVNFLVNPQVDNDQYGATEPEDLEVDAFLFAPNGKLDVEQLTDYEANEDPMHGFVIPAKDPTDPSSPIRNFQISDPTQANYYYMEENPDELVDRKLPPIYCYKQPSYVNELGGTCPITQEKARSTGDFSLFGSMVVKNYSNLKAIHVGVREDGTILGDNVSGIWERTIRYNDMFSVLPPLGAPTFEAPKVMTLSRQSYGGRSSHFPLDLR